MNNKKEETKMLTTSQELYDYVMNEYKKTDQELTSSFFDVPVHMKERDILLAYQTIQHDTNGDDVVQLCSEIEFWTGAGEDTEIFGSEVLFAGEKRYDAIFTGCCEDFLKNIMRNEKEHHMYRLMDMQRHDNNVGGVKLSFIW